MESKQRILSPYCAKLKSKKAHFQQAPPQTNREVVDGSNHCWCELTQMALGPDREVVDPDDCRVERACYIPYGHPKPSV